MLLTTSSGGLAGQARVVDVRAEDEMDDRAREAFAATERAGEAVGWEFEWAGRPDPVLMVNEQPWAYRRLERGTAVLTLAQRISRRW